MRLPVLHNVALAFGVALLCAAGVAPLSAQTNPSVSTFYTFPSTDQPFTAPLIEAGDGNIYGVVTFGGTDGYGYIYKVVTGNTVSLDPIYSFTGSTDGLSPLGGITQGSDGNFYGTTTGMNSSHTQVNGGTIFKLTVGSTYSFSLLHAFTAATDGSAPLGTLVQATDGNFYGMTSAGGANSLGTIFKISPGGTFTKIYDFTSTTGGWNDNPSQLTLVQASDGNLYGVTGAGGANTYGSIFQLTLPGLVFKTIYSFKDNGDGVGPNGGLVESSDGNLYGVTSDTVAGNASNAAPTLFKVTTGGTLTTLFTFPNTSPYVDGSDPTAGLYLAGDGNFYGATRDGGCSNCGGGVGGTLYEYSSGGNFSVLYDFAQADNGPSASLFQPDSGNLAGTTPGSDGGNGTAAGTIYGLTFSPGIARAVQLTFSIPGGGNQGAITLGQTETLSWSVPNAFSDTLQQCYAYQPGTTSGGGTWAGKQTGTASSSGYSGSATITPTAVGTYNYTLTCGGTETGTATLVVSPGSGPVQTTTTLTISPSSPSVGQNVTLTATVVKASGSGVPTGTVQFVYAGDILQTVTLNGSGVANFTASTSTLLPGSYALQAKYSGDTNDLSSTGNLTATLSKNATSTVMTVTPGTVGANSTATLKATVTRADGAGTATGTVTFYYETIALGPAVTLNGSGVATMTASDSGIPASTYPLHAVYSGDATDNGSTSPNVNVVVQ